MEKQQIAQIRRFVIKLGKAMHEYGTPTHRLERILVKTTELLGLKGSFIVSPTSMTFVFWEQGCDEEYSHSARVNPSGLDLNRLAYIHQLAEEVLSGKLSLEDGLARLNAINTLAAPYPYWLEFIAWGTLSASFAVVCGGNLIDMLLAAIWGWLVFGFNWLTQHHKRWEEMLEPLSAVVIAFGSSGLKALGLEIHISMVILAGIIVFIPGLSLTIGLRELAAKHLVSGTARIMDAGMTLFKLYFGAILGLALAQLFWPSTPNPPALVINHWSYYLAILLLAISLLIIFKISHKDALWGLLAGIIAYTGAVFGSHVLGANLGGLIGALIVGLYANLYGYWKNKPTQIVLLPGLVLLVPGSKAYLGIDRLVAGQDALATAVNGAPILLAFMSLIAGLIFANAILPPRERM
ncbi:threonine/serine ThrE exporter family protein [Thiolinea disciformis]|uniref:threonine/serine ThrE exporter family protein n=1 Tax=Thiolinea disciformis TaxID=125614 RepID=UPI00036AEFF6|nr:threonine/serine exporter family protein [Thiolinea disciformis]